MSRSDFGRTYYGLMLEGCAEFTLADRSRLQLAKGDFVLIPAAMMFVMCSPGLSDSVQLESQPSRQADGYFRLGDPTLPAEAAWLVGHCHFDTPDEALLMSLLPQLVLVRDQPRLTTLAQLIRDEALANRSGKEVVIERLLEVLLIEALRSSQQQVAAPGLIKGLADERLANTLKALHQAPEQPWTVAKMAKAAALSRSAFFERFSRALGIPPMEYLLSWRMALAKKMLSQRQGSVAKVAEQVGYSSASTFSVAFSRYVGKTPSAFSKLPAQVLSAE